MSSFHNTEPRTREERLAAQNRDLLEKSMLRSRRGNYHEYQEPGNPLVPEASSPMYSAESNRFQRDVAGEIRQQKLTNYHKQQEMYDRKRQQVMQHEVERWQTMEAERQAEVDRIQHIRESGLKGRTNKSSEHFNIISLSYHPTKEGKQLQYKDEVTRYRAVLRSQNLFNKSHSVPHNIITGEARHNPVGLPPAPAPPQQE